MKYYTGSGLLNSAIIKLSFELHIPTYRFCGPGTKLKERLQRGNQPKNPFDRSCLEHELFYSREKSTELRHEADKILTDEAMQRFHWKDASPSEKLAAVARAKKTKGKLGMGLKPQNTATPTNNQNLNIFEKNKILTANTLRNIQNGIG